jgi:tetratricopeptide (TPR) repeat protein
MTMIGRFSPESRCRPRLAALAAILMLLSAPAGAITSDEDLGLSGLSGSYLAARTADVEKDVVSAARFYSQALKSDPTNTLLLERAVVSSAAAGETTDALRFARELLKEQPDNNVARLVTAIEEIRTEKYAAALKSLDNTGAGVLADLTAGLLKAWTRFGEGEVDLAIEELDKLKGEEWYEPFKLLHGAYIALAAGRTSEALERLEKAHSEDANAVRITEAYARALKVAGKTEQAEAVLRDFLLRYPDNSLARAALDDIRAEKSSGEAIATPVEGAAEALAGIGAAVGQEGGAEVAFLYLRLALYLDPEIAGGLAALSLGDLLSTSNQGEAAIEIYESIAPGTAFRALGQLRAALALDALDRTAEAEVAFKRAIDANPDDIQSYISYGNMLRGRERFDESAVIYGQAIGRIPEPTTSDWSLFYYRGISYERSKEWPKAEADFKKALELSPDQPLVLNYLGYSWVDKGMNLQEAMTMIKKAVELRPNDGFIVDSLGWAHYRLGEHEKAVEELERAVGLRPDDPVINDHLGDAYWKAGRELEAQFQWRHARDFGAEGPELELILKKIAEGRLIEATPEKKDAALRYTVKPGDSLWTISAALLQSGDAFQKIIDANRDKLSSPDQIYPGMELVIPGDI